MRLNYYRFPECVDAHTRYINGADSLKAECFLGIKLGSKKCLSYEACGGCRSCSYFRSTNSEDTISGISVTRAKQLLKEFGGTAWTCHIDRDGGCFETSEIKINENNSRFKYNRHL